MLEVDDPWLWMSQLDQQVIQSVTLQGVRVATKEGEVTHWHWLEEELEKHSGRVVESNLS